MAQAAYGSGGRAAGRTDKYLDVGRQIGTKKLIQVLARTDIRTAAGDIFGGGYFLGDRRVLHFVIGDNVIAEMHQVILVQMVHQDPRTRPAVVEDQHGGSGGNPAERQKILHRRHKFHRNDFIGAKDFFHLLLPVHQADIKIRAAKVAVAVNGGRFDLDNPAETLYDDRPDFFDISGVSANNGYFYGHAAISFGEYFPPRLE